MTRTYQLNVEIRIEGDAETLPSLVDVAEEVTCLVTDSTNYNFECRVRPVLMTDDDPRWWREELFDRR